MGWYDDYLSPFSGNEAGRQGLSRGFGSVQKKQPAINVPMTPTLPLSYERPQVQTVNPMPQLGANMPLNYGTEFNGGGGGNAAVNTTPANPPVDYSSFSNGDLSAVDSTLQDQLARFAQAMKHYQADDTRQRGVLQGDRDAALAGIDRNEVAGLTGINEDFASRGLGKSGLLFEAQNKAHTAFDRQGDNVRNQYSKGIDNLDMKLRNFTAENGEAGSNVQAARRDALARLAAKQTLV